jgi:hypothetical protein
LKESLFPAAVLSVGGKIISGQNLPIAGRMAIARGGKIRQNDFWPFLDVGEV